MWVLCAGVQYWFKGAFDVVHVHFAELGAPYHGIPWSGKACSSSRTPPQPICTALAAAIFFEYCKRGSNGASSIAEALTLSTREFATLCKETKIPVAVGTLSVWSKALQGQCVQGSASRAVRGCAVRSSADGPRQSAP